MTWVKICGITSLEDALTAVDAGADALGFVFYEKSPRKIDPETARGIVECLPPGVGKIGVFVDETVERILATTEQAGMTAAQLHGAGSRQPAFMQALKSNSHLKLFVVLSAAEVAAGQGWDEDANGNVSAVFFDSGTPDLPGGTGRIFDWNASVPGIQAVGEKVKVVVAGGLNSSNVEDAIRILKPWGVDVASGVEARPGKKDPEKVRAFIEAVRKVEQKN
jgi:phosphoribosylanthranilate isomerase